mgnify:CR=1 FL=1
MMKKLIKKNILIIYKLLLKIYLFFKKIFTFHLHLGSYDYYPAARINGFSFFKNDKTRLEFWTRIAKLHPSLKHFYSENPEESYTNYLKNCKSNIHHDEKLKKILKEFYRNGAVEVANFFNPSEHAMIKKYFKEKIDSKISDYIKYSWTSYSKNLNRTIHNKIKIFEKAIFDKNIKMQSYTLSAWKKPKNQKSEYQESVNFHSDRFIPAIKLIYFPNKVSIDPFEYCIGSHKIDNQFIKNYEIIHSHKTNDLSAGYLNYENYEKKKYEVEENTLIIAATHGLHRRSQSKENTEQGVRQFITIGYYNLFTRYDLIKNYFNKNV